jgi:sugar lactone lactonase YvrE
VLAVADVKLSTVVFFALDGTPEPGSLSIDLREPESVAWTPDGLLAIADTWGQGVVLHDYEGGATRSLPEPQDGWYGPRGIAVAADGTVAVTDTGHKRLVLLSSEGGEVVISLLGRGGSAPGEFVEPVGLSWESNDRLLVCDTGNHRLQLMDRSGKVHKVVELPGAWSDFYSRPQAVVLAEGLWVVTDPPASALWIVRDGEPRSVSLAEHGLTPAGVAAGESSLYVTDLTGRVWVFELILNN